MFKLVLLLYIGFSYFVSSVCDGCLSCPEMTFLRFSPRRVTLYRFHGFLMGCFLCFLPFFMEGSQSGSRHKAQ
jgi:hypothetical protein